MNLQELQIKVKKLFRPDLNLPMHIRRRIYKIYKFELFNNIEEVAENEIINSQEFSNFVNIKDLTLGDKLKYFVDIKDVN